MTAREPDKHALIFIFITVLINMIGFGIVMPVMPQLIKEVTGQGIASAAQWGGYLTVSYAMAQFFMAPIMGGLSDRFGRRPVLLVSLAAYSVDYFMMALAPSITLILLARIFAGVFAATFATANAYIADISPPEKRAANFGLLGAAFGMGFVIGPAIGGFVGEQFGPRAPFYVVAMLGVINFIYGWFVLPETLKPENRRPFSWKRANALGNFQQFRRYPVVLPIALATVILQIAHWAFPSVWAYFAEARLSWTPKEIGLSLMFVGLMGGLVQAGLTRVIIPKIGEARSVLIGVSVATLAYLGYAFAGDGRIIYALIMLSALSGLTDPAVKGILSRTIPANAQGELQGAVSALSSLGMIIGPIVMTQIFAAFTNPQNPVRLLGVTVSEKGAPFYFPGAPFLFAAMLSLLAFIPLTIALRRTARQNTAPETPTQDDTNPDNAKQANTKQNNAEHANDAHEPQESLAEPSSPGADTKTGAKTA